MIAILIYVGDWHTFHLKSTSYKCKWRSNSDDSHFNKFVPKISQQIHTYRDLIECTCKQLLHCDVTMYTN
jgi:hypothetical protein